MMIALVAVGMILMTKISMISMTAVRMMLSIKPCQVGAGWVDILMRIRMTN